MCAASWRFLWWTHFEMYPSFISHIWSFGKLHIDTNPIHANSSRLNFYRNTLVIISSCKILALKLARPVRLSERKILFTSNLDLARRAKFVIKETLSSCQIWFERLMPVDPNLQLKNLARRPRLIEKESWSSCQIYRRILPNVSNFNKICPHC